ncbi:hypothetical protein AB0O31_10485 [Kitasatospora cineracea]|uniref:hypothetical protein n=1 Tax=Kitasatospora cineracea TaxID=88074 RepID=UPI00344812AA
MRLVHLVLTSAATPRPGAADAERVLDTLWAHLEPGSGIEHIRVRPGPDRIDLGLFLRGDGPAAPTATEAERAGIARLLSRIPEWRPEPPH